jgi:5-methylcytosine-specific restriction endonuclease McrA
MWLRDSLWALVLELTSTKVSNSNLQDSAIHYTSNNNNEHAIWNLQALNNNFNGNKFYVVQEENLNIHKLDVRC